MSIREYILILFVGAVFLSGCSSTPEKPALPQDWANIVDEDDFLDRMQFLTGTGFINNLSPNKNEIPKLKKIGIISFSLYQPTTGKGRNFMTPYLTESGSEFFVDKLYNPAIPAMKKSFSEQGMKLLTPDEFLDTAQKKQQYKAIKFENSGTWKAVIAISNRIRGAASKDVKAQPDGMKYLLLTAADAKIWRAAGKFAGDMGLDAVLIVETTVALSNGYLTLRKISTSLVGPNSVPYSKDDENYYAPFGPVKGYIEGVIFGNYTGTPPKGAALLAVTEDGRMTQDYFAGMDTVYGRIASEVIKKSLEAIEELKD